MVQPTVQIDFFGETPPGEATRYIVGRYTRKLVEQVLKDLEEFSLKLNLKEKALSQLYNTIICVEGKIKPFAERILKQVVYKLILDEESTIAHRVLKITELLGLYVETEFLVPMIVQHLTDQDSKTVPLFVQSCLTALSAVITHSSVRFADQFDSQMDKLLDLIVSSDYLQCENADVLARTAMVTNNIVFAGGQKSCKPRQHVLFKILLQLASSPLIESQRGLVNGTIDLLARNCGLEKGSDLFSCELEQLIIEMKEDYENWTRSSPERFIFDLLVRRAETAVVDFWEEILEIIAMNIDFSKDVELRFDMLSLCEHLLQQENLHSTIIFYTEILIRMILMPCTEWRAGMPIGKIRKASVICLIKVMEQKLIEKEKLTAIIPDLINKLKSPLDDDWLHDLRFASVVLLSKLMDFMGHDMDRESFNEIYPELLKRLDDAQDGIRIETCKAFEVFFDNLPSEWSSSLYPYTVKQIFIHIDDPNQ
mmetsp:Transcript_882/g.1328  ORF Transcript_882/g.1328 Transcript_882/m.1328 type:complete len:481 (+) Transcript_882:28-1470(+)